MILTFASELLKRRGLPPFLLLKSFATSRTLRPTSVMLASANEFLRHFWIQYIASIRMAIAHAPTPDTDIFDGVKVLKYNKFSCNRSFRLSR